MVEGLLAGAENWIVFEQALEIPLFETECETSLLVIGATEVHPDTSRTRSLSPSAPMVLGGRPPGRVGHCQETFSF